MRILYPKKPYIASKDITIAQALRLIRENNGYPLNLINKDKSLFGVLSNGDIAKFLSINTDKSLEATKAEEAANHFPVVAHKNDSLETIELYLKPENIKSIPVIDIDRNIIKVITKEAPSIKIGEYTIDNDCSPYLIAEIGVNHNGDTKEAKYLIENAKQAGCNAVKFQHRSKSLYSLEDINSYDLGTQYILSEIERTYLSIEQLAECCKFAEDIGIAVIITPFDEVALDEITESKITIAALKIASCDLTNISLIKKCGETKNPLILSTGMSFEREIIKTSKLLRDLMIAHAFLHCNSTYPNPVEDCNLKYIKRLKKITKTIVGYSSHDGNEIIPISSVAMGAKIIEFHITRSKESLGTDHRASIEVKNLKKLVESCKFVNLSMGKSTPRIPSQGELSNRISLGKSYALKNNKKKGERINNDELILISPGSGFNVNKKFELLGKKLKKDIKARTLIKKSDLYYDNNLKNKELNNAINGLFKIGYKVGIPVRYHDFESLHQIFNAKMYEFHMSDRDLNLPCDKYIHKRYEDVDLIVHAVEQYEDGFILDLASKDNFIREKSFKELDRLFKHIDKLRTYFKKKNKIPVVINPGGFTTDNFLNDKEYNSCLKRMAISLEELNKLYPDYDILPQTMPPFPWHQGGRSYHNVLTNKNKISDFIENVSNNICFDVSHSALSCGYFKEDILQHINIMNNRITHIHLSDAQGQNAEGLEIGNGVLNFKEIHEQIKFTKNKIYLIPEIWQGHLNEGEAFARSIIRFYDLINS